MKESFLRCILYGGVAITVFGIIFHLQGRGVVGPEESFMYQSQDWVNHGITIIIIGVTVTVALGAIRIRRVLGRRA